MKTAAALAVALLGIAGCGASDPSYTSDDLDSAYSQCNLKVVISNGDNAAFVQCMRERVDGLGFTAAKKYLQRREKDDAWLGQTP